MRDCVLVFVDEIVIVYCFFWCLWDEVVCGLKNLIWDGFIRNFVVCLIIVGVVYDCVIMVFFV